MTEYIKGIIYHTSIFNKYFFGLSLLVDYYTQIVMDIL